MRFKKILALGLALGALGSFLGGCSSKKDAVQASNRTKIVFWHEMTGQGQDALEELVDEFNKSQDKYTVVPTYAGSYNEVIQKVLNTHGTDASPAIFQSMDISTAQMYYSGYTTPMQKFIDEDNYDVSQISDVARAFYSKDNQQLSMPFNTSQPVLYYNATLLKEYGITPPPKDPSYSDIARVANELYEKSNHKVKGMSVEIYGWFFEQFMANSNTLMANHQNGRSGVATKVNFTNDATVKAMQWIQDNLKKGSFMNYGAGSNAGTNETAAFLSRKLGMFLQSSGSITQLTTGTKDEIGVCYYPHPDGQEANGVSIGGASLWISNDKSDKVQRGAWELTKFLLSAKSQAKWQAATGYLALNKNSQKQKVLVDLYKKNPAAKVASDQLNRTTANTANSGIFMQNLVQERTLSQTAMEQIYAGADIKKALQEAQDSMNSYIASSNQAEGFK